MLFATLLFGAVAAQAGVLHGTVRNGTTGKTVGGVEVILLQLQGGMQPVGNSRTDAQGKFTFDNASVGAQPMLVRAVYKGINFHTPLPPGRSDIEVAVFEPSKDPKTIAVGSRIVFFQPNGSMLTVGEEYAIQNNSQPPQAFFRSDGNFEFSIPDNAQLQQVAAAGPAGMPVVQAPIDKKKGRYAISYAFRPGQNTVRYSYEIPYPGDAATVKVPTVYPTARLLVVAPPSMQISGEGLQSSGQEQGMSVYSRENLTPATVVAVNVSGTAPPLQAGAAAADSGSQGQDAQGGAATVSVQQVPGRLDVLKWPLIGGFVVVFALGALLLTRKPVVAVVGGPAAQPLGARAANAANSGPVSAGMAQVDAAVGTSLDALKDQIFRLELRHQARERFPNRNTRRSERARKKCCAIWCEAEG